MAGDGGGAGPVGVWVMRAFRLRDQWINQFIRFGAVGSLRGLAGLDFFSDLVLLVLIRGSSTSPFQSFYAKLNIVFQEFVGIKARLPIELQ